MGLRDWFTAKPVAIAMEDDSTAALMQHEPVTETAEEQASTHISAPLATPFPTTTEPDADALEAHLERNYTMSSLQQSVQDLLAIEGAVGAAIVDLASGMALATGGNPGFNLEVASAGNANVLQAKLRTMTDLDLSDEIEDVLITLGRQYHLLNVMNHDDTKGLFIYLVLNRTTANLALARHKLRLVASNLTV